VLTVIHASGGLTLTARAKFKRILQAIAEASASKA